jgi:EmrB/QacA subfamily drug resistance transporter
VLFVAASVACGLAPSMGALVVARFLQGAAAAVMMPSSLALISQANPDPIKRARAVAVWALGAGVASSSGPVLGGLLTLASWRLIFFINVPVGAVAILLVARSAPSLRRRVPFDWWGQVTAVLAMGGLTYGAIEAGAHSFTAPHVLAAFVVAGVALAGFVVAQRIGAHPMVPLDLFRSRNVSVAVAVGFAFVVGFYGLPFVMSLYLQQLRGLTPFETGLVFMPMMVIGAVLVPLSPRIAERFGARLLISGGLSLMTVGLVVLALVPSSVPLWTLAGLMLLVGAAGPLIMPPVTAVLLNSVPTHQAGTASGVFNTSRQLGGALAVAVFGALVAEPDSFMRGQRLSLLIAAAVASVAAVASLLLRAAPAGHPASAEANRSQPGPAPVAAGAH